VERTPPNRGRTNPGRFIERIYWSAVGSLADSPEELTDEATYQLKNASSTCP
jgi:hypothetical protein